MMTEIRLSCAIAKPKEIWYYSPQPTVRNCALQKKVALIWTFLTEKKEIDYLRKERDLSKKVARMTVVTGRRRVGKTQLIQHAMDDEP